MDKEFSVYRYIANDAWLRMMVCVLWRMLKEDKSTDAISHTWGEITGAIDYMWWHGIVSLEESKKLRTFVTDVWLKYAKRYRIRNGKEPEDFI